MKKILYIALSLLLTLGIAGCNDWLDVNVDPDNPNNSSATVESRLPWIQHYYMYAWGNASMRGVTIAGLIPRQHHFNKRFSFRMEPCPGSNHHLIPELVYWRRM